MECSRCHMRDVPKVEGRGGPRTRCDKCSEYTRGWYVRNKIRQKERIEAHRQKILSLKREHILEYWKTHPCVDCGEDDPVVLQFDHIKGKKTATINYLLNGARSFERLLVELEKCEIVCANCHFRRTAKRSGNWWKSLT